MGGRNVPSNVYGSFIFDAYLYYNVFVVFNSLYALVPVHKYTVPNEYSLNGRNIILSTSFTIPRLYYSSKYVSDILLERYILTFFGQWVDYKKPSKNYG